MTFLILIFPESFALMMESINEVVVVLKGISLISKVFLSNSSMRALIRIFPPRNPSLYELASIIPPVKKSGNKFTFLFESKSIEACNNSQKL